MISLPYRTPDRQVRQPSTSSWQSLEWFSRQSACSEQTTTTTNQHSLTWLLLIHTSHCMQVTFCFFSTVCYSFLFFILFVTQISREPLNGFVPNSHGGRVWSLAQTSMNVKVTGQSQHGQKTHCPLPSASTPSPPGNDRMEHAWCKWRHLAANGTIPSMARGDFSGFACSVCLVKHL